MSFAEMAMCAITIFPHDFGCEATTGICYTLLGSKIKVWKDAVQMCNDRNEHLLMPKSSAEWGYYPVNIR